MFAVVWTAALVLIGSSWAACPAVQECQERASSWEDGAWFGVGFGWAGLAGAVALESHPAADIPNFAAGGSIVGFGLAVPLMAAAASPSHRAVDLSENTLRVELRRRPRYWVMYTAGMAAGATATGLVLTDTGPWWLSGGLALGAAGVFTGSAAGFARDARWVRRQAPIVTGRPRHPLRLQLLPSPGGARLRGTW